MFINSCIQHYKFSLKRSEKAFFSLKEQLFKKKKKVSTQHYEHLRSLLVQFRSALDSNNKQKAYELKKRSLEYFQTHFKKDWKDFFNEWVVGFGGVLLLVAVINQVWFQNYQIPSGSMRPTLMEKDRLIATKTSFGINLPFAHRPLYFDSKQLKRGNLVILENDRLSKKENQSRYLFIFPARKQFVKRLVGKSGDTLYFYGGKIYGLDAQGNEIQEFQSSDAFKPLEHIPFNSFEGKVLSAESSGTQNISSPVYLYQMDQLVGKLSFSQSGEMQGQFYHDSKWTPESPSLSYQELWGIKNYAMARIVPKKWIENTPYLENQSNTPYYLELFHTPSFEAHKPTLGLDLEGRFRPKLSYSRSYVPLYSKHFERIQKAMNTSRFVVKGGYVGNYSLESDFKPHRFSPYFETLPDGTFEIIQGVAYQVKKNGMQVKLPKSHPLNSNDPEFIQRMFNLGMQMITLFEPQQQRQDFIPSRYAYFRKGDLYLLGQPLMINNEPELKQFIQSEMASSTPFIDRGPPINPDGSLNKDLIKQFGLKIPEGHYLCLGDNHAGSRDCRDWGFIPQKNLQGSPAFIFWPNSARKGAITQNGLPWKNMSTLIVSLCALACFAYSYTKAKKSRKRPL